MNYDDPTIPIFVDDGVPDDVDGYNYSVEYDRIAGAFMATALNQTYHYSTEAEAWRHVAVGLDKYIHALEAALLWKYGLRQADVVNLMDDCAGHAPRPEGE